MYSHHKQIYRILTTVIVGISVFSLYQHFSKKMLETKVENNYNRAFHELVSYVDDIDTLLEKSMLVSSPSQLSTISSELFRQTTAAKACLGQLPISEVQLENTEKFLSQIGDFTYMLSQNVINDNKISEEEYNTLSTLSKYAANLNNGLTTMQNDIYSQKISFGTVGKKSNGYFNNIAYAQGNDILSNFETVEKEFQEYPSLIYDGPFSEHIEAMKPAMLEKKPEISQEEGLKVAKRILRNKATELIYSGESRNTNMDSYSYSAESPDRNIYVSITKKGGLPVYFLDTKDISQANITPKEASEFAKTFLYDIGFSSLTQSYYDVTNNIATINFAYIQSGIICYSDLIKVKVSLADGEIMGFEAHGYIMNNKHRDFPSIKISESDAINRINPHLKVDSHKMAMIPKDSKKEVLCYEFRGNHNGKNFLIYINAENGNEEEILMLIESENGTLTI